MTREAELRKERIDYIEFIIDKHKKYIIKLRNMQDKIRKGKDI